MAKFIAISGPSTTGKTTLVNSLSTYSELSKVIFGPDMHDKVWRDLVDQKYFSEYKEITADSDYLCLYIIRLIDQYNNYIKSLEESDALVILDGCWMDLFIYSILNMWYTRIIKSVQEDILSRVSIFDDKIDRIYITTADDEKYPVDKFRLRGKITTFRANRPLEIQYYKMFSNFQNAVTIESTDMTDSSLFIVQDLKHLGYI